MNPSLIFTQYDVETNNIKYIDLELLLAFKTHLIDPRLKDEIYTLWNYLYTRLDTNRAMNNVKSKVYKPHTNIDNLFPSNNRKHSLLLFVPI